MPRSAKTKGELHGFAARRAVDDYVFVDVFVVVVVVVLVDLLVLVLVSDPRHDGRTI